MGETLTVLVCLKFEKPENIGPDKCARLFSKLGGNYFFFKLIWEERDTKKRALSYDIIQQTSWVETVLRYWYESFEMDNKSILSRA